MAHTIQHVVLSDFPDVDLIALIPSLFAYSAGNQNPADWDNIGPSIFGYIVVAAVEKFAKTKKIDNGKTMSLRTAASALYMSSMTRTAYHLGRQSILQELLDQEPNLSSLLSTRAQASVHQIDLEKRSLAFRAAEILTALERQSTEKTKRGKNLNPHIFAPDSNAALVDLQDRETIAIARGKLSLTERIDPIKVKGKIREAVKDGLDSGLLPLRGSNLKESIDTHCKRILSKLEL